MFQRFFNWRFWTSSRPEALTPKMLWFFVGIFGFCVIFSFVLRFLVYSLRRNLILVKVLRKVYKFFSTIGIIGFIFLFFTYEQIVFLGSYFWYLVLFLGSLVWFGFIIYFLIREIPKEKAALEEKRRFEKYLPR